MSAENWEIFKDVKMWRSKQDPTANMEYLWNLSDPVTGEDPAANSMFNLTTLREIVYLGQNEVNILADKDTVWSAQNL